MKRLLLSFVAASTFASAVTATASAAPWLSINQRQALIEERIDQGVRSGSLTREEAVLLRGEFRTLARLEAQYRRSDDELSTGERVDLDRRFERLNQKVRIQKRDDDERGGGKRWIPINERQARIDARIDEGIRRGALTRSEAIRLRGEFQTLIRLESEYRRSRGVFTMEERADLDRRLEKLSLRVMSERRDTQGRW